MTLAIVNKIDEAAGLQLQLQHEVSKKARSRGDRLDLTWAQLGLSSAPDVKRRDNRGAAELRWRFYVVDCRSRGEASKRVEKGTAGYKKLLYLRARPGGLPEDASSRETLGGSGVLACHLGLEDGAQLQVLASGKLLALAPPLSICLRHRDDGDGGAACFCGEAISRKARLATFGSGRSVKVDEEEYASHWGRAVEFEAATMAVEAQDSRLLYNIDITWETLHSDNVRRGHFEIPFHFAKTHKLRFRGLVRNGGETASGFLCLRQSWQLPGHSTQDPDVWAAHARVIGACIPGHGSDSALLVVDDDDIEPSPHRRRGVGGLVRVTFELLPETSSVGLPPAGSKLVVEYLAKEISYQVLHIGLAEVNQNERTDGSAAPSLLARDVVLGRVQATEADKHPDRENLSCWSLNTSQELALRRGLGMKLQLIHGPPGTGKTRLAACLLAVLARRNRHRRAAVLVAAPTNKAVDQVLKATSDLCEGLRLLRIYSADIEATEFPMPRRVRRERLDSGAPPLSNSLRTFAWHWRCHAAGDLKGDATDAACEARQAYSRLKSSLASNDPDFETRRREYICALSRARAEEVRRADIIFTTCVSVRRNAFLEALWSDRAPQVLQVVVDEAGQATEPEALCAMASAVAAESIFLFGDHKQLRPLVKSRVAEKAGLGVSLFERLIGQPKYAGFVTQLAQQYRMHPTISCFPNRRFYKSTVEDAPSIEAALPTSLLMAARPSKEMAAAEGEAEARTNLLFWTAGGAEKEELQSVRTANAGGINSRANAAEARRAATLAGALAAAAGETAVAVLTWYNKQVDVLRKLMDEQGRGNVHVGTISTAQGSEWDYVVLSTVRTAEPQRRAASLGLLSDANVLTVALTRARVALVVLGNREALERDANWAALVRHCDKSSAVTQHTPHVSRQAVAPTSKHTQSKPAVVVTKVRLDLRERSRSAHRRQRQDRHRGASPSPPAVNDQKKSAVEFDGILRKSAKLSSYSGRSGGAGGMPAAPPEQSSEDAALRVEAHKGVFFGVQPTSKKRPAAKQADEQLQGSAPSRQGAPRKMNVKRLCLGVAASDESCEDEDAAWIGG
eukprot:TRINITY_DN37960_c0_g1_i1.p1 TRINITY_DN37960_c0_g1~~TRINITY_DN37960_c0_g1_i1.p1  ORF type:complete len:1078 (-),score=184.77 TRINITY_DN37960_c0_g1_i1:131-3364(-)